MTGAIVPRHPIRLVVSDIDGTLVNKAKVITPRAQAALAALKARGVAFTVASARPPAGLRSIIKATGIETIVASVNGGAIIRPDLSLVERLEMPAEAVAMTISMLRQQGIDPWIFTADKWYLHDPEGPHVEHEARTIGLTPLVVDDIGEEHVRDVLKIVGASHDHALLAECERILQAALGGLALATRSQAYYLDITHPAANKGAAVKALARNLGIAVEHVLTIGDGANDAPMFKVSGFSVAMGNATDAVKNVAAVVTDSCEDEGFAKAIERYVLQDTAGQETSQ